LAVLAGATFLHLNSSPVVKLVGTADGRFTFDLPPGWHRVDCPAARSDCVQVEPDLGTPDDAVIVGYLEPNPVEGTPIDFLLSLPDGTTPDGDIIKRTTVDGRSAVRMEPSADRDILVIGALGPGQFFVDCAFRWHEAAIRAGCDVVVKTLKIRK
jgi:hypothetical protein